MWDVVDWAELVTLDLSLFDKPGGKAKLAKQLEHAVHHVGKCFDFSSSPSSPPLFSNLDSLSSLDNLGSSKLNCQLGFFYVQNFGMTQEEVDNQFALGREFYNLSLDEKLKYHNAEDLDTGNYNGYRPAGRRE